MADSISKLAGMLESARELTLEAASTASARLMDETRLKAQPQDISAMLNSRSDKERLTGMKHVISIMSKGEDASNFFADVIKNIASTNLEVRKLVYAYLLKYAEFQPDLALLSINTIQKSLSDRNPFVRSAALRVMSGIKVVLIVPIVTLAVKQSCYDPSPLVRRASVEALGNCIDLDPSTSSTCIEMLSKFLSDRDVSVLGSALVVLSRHFPDRLDLLHSSYRKICEGLNSMDEWSQIMTLELLLKYCRLFIPRPIFKNGQQVLDKDLELLVRHASKLLYSNDGAVVLSVACLFFYLDLDNCLTEYDVAGFLVRLLRSDANVQYVALVNIREIIRKDATNFIKHVGYFLLFPDDSVPIAVLKIDILTLLCNENNISLILSELRMSAITSRASKIISASVIAMAKCALYAENSWQEKTMKWLLRQIRGNNHMLISESLTAIRFLIQQDVGKHVDTLYKVAACLDDAKAAKARASIIWLVGEYSYLIPETAPDVFRKSAKTFLDEEESVRYQIILLAAKMYSRYLTDLEEKEKTTETDSPIPLLFEYIIHLGKFDSSYDNRDRTRMLSSLLESSLNKEIATLILQVAKPLPEISVKNPSETEDQNHLLLGTSALFFGAPNDGYRSLPDWTPNDELIDSSVRDAPDVSRASTTTSSNGGDIRAISNTHNTTKMYEPSNTRGIDSTKRLKEQSLDKFFGDESESGSGSESETSDEDDNDDDDQESSEDNSNESQNDESDESNKSDDDYSTGSGNEQKVPLMRN